MSDHLDGQHLTHACSYHHGIHYLLHNLYQNQQLSSIQEVVISNLCQKIDPNVHIRIFKKTIKHNGETKEVNIINLFGFTLRLNIYEWGEIFV